MTLPLWEGGWLQRNLHVMTIFVRQHFDLIVARAVANPFEGFFDDGRLHRDVVRLAGIRADGDVRRRDARSALLAGDRRQRRDDAAAHTLGLAAARDNRRRAVARAAAARAEHDVDALRLELLRDFGAGLVPELLDVAAAAHERICFFRQRTDESLLDKLMQTVNREHGVDILVDVGIVEAAMRDHELRRRRVELDRAVGEIAGRIEWNLALLMDAACRDERDLAFGKRLLELGEDRRRRERDKDFGLKSLRMK